MSTHPRLLRFSTATLTLLACCGSIAAEIAPLNGPIFTPKLQTAVDEHVLPGAVMLVALKDKILHLEAVGYSDLGAQKPMQVDDLFWIASMSKPVTAAAFMILVDEGLVNLDDPVEKFIPEFKELKVAQPDDALTPPSHPIRIREILSHTSGLRFLNKKDHQLIDSAPLGDSVQNDLLEPLLFDPGTKYTYSNEGIDTAGRIIEILTKMPYEKFLQDRLFTPLGMVDTTFSPTSLQLKRLAKSYRTNTEKGTLDEINIQYLTYPLDGAARYPAPGGGLFSTAKDMARFCQMLASGGTFEGKPYLSKESVHLMTTKQTGDKVADKYGFGLSVSDGSAFGHGGAYKTFMNVDHGVIRVFLVQHTGKWSKGDPSSEFTAAVHALHLETGAPTKEALPATAPEGSRVP